MEAEDKTKEQLIKELRRRIDDLEKSESHNKYFDFYNFSPISYFTFDKKGLIIEVNHTGANKLGIERSFLIKTPFSVYVASGSRDAFYLHLRQVFRTNTRQTYEIKLVDKNKNQFDALLESQAVQDSEGSFSQCQTAIIDITERELSEAALRESEERYRKLVEFSPDAIAIHSEGKIVFINTAGAKLVGAVNPEQLIGKSVMDFVHPDYQEIVRERIRLMREEGKNGFPTEEKFIKLDGSVIDVEVTAMPFTYQGKPGIQVIIRDITDRKSAEEALKQSEEKYRNLIENIQDGVFVIQGTKIQFFNEALAKMVGYTAEEVIGKDFREFIAPEDLEMVMDYYRRRHAGEDVPREYEFNAMHRDGTKIIININIGHINYNGRVASIGTVKDITGRRRAEEELRKSEERFRQISESAGEWIWEVDADGLYTYSSPVIEKILGYKPQEIVGKKHFYDLFVPDVREKLKNAAFETFARKEFIRGFVNPNIHKNGNIVILETSGLPILNERGNLLGYRGTDTDITEHKRSEEQVQEQAALLDKAQDAILVLNLEDSITYWNKSAERLYGWTVEEAIGRNASEILYKDKKDSPHHIEAQKRVVKKGEWSGELHQVTKDGSEIIIESRWTLMHDNKGKPKSILVINTDITGKKKLEEQFLRAQRMESIGTLAGGIAHDINNVLTPIMLSQELLRENLTDEESKKLLNTIKRSTHRGANLMKQVLSFTKGVEGERNILQVAQLVSEIRQIVKETFQRNIHIRTDIPRDLWTISGDATQLHQVIMNLCMNARDAMPDGGTLGISAENLFIDESVARDNVDARAGPYVMIAVSDTGTGIPPKIMDRIFEPFFTTKEHGKGTGLGLSTALGILKSHGGFITVYSEVGKGTTFKVYLPSTITTTEVLKAQEHQYELPAGHGESILVVDDEDQVLKITKKTLETHGYKVITANDGKEAIALYSKHREKIKLILMDMMMPVMDGSTSIQELHKINPELKIIAVSGLTEKDKLKKNVDACEYTFLTKPYTAERLLKTIHEILSAKQGLSE